MKSYVFFKIYFYIEKFIQRNIASLYENSNSVYKKKSIILKYSTLIQYFNEI